MHNLVENNLFGTDGIRGTVGTGIFIPENIARLGLAVGRWIVEQYGENCTILIGQDTRASAQWIVPALVDSILSYPIKIYAAGIIPTPAAPILMQQLPHIACSFIISASHNPACDNGIKCIDAQGNKLSENHELSITHYFYQASQTHRTKKLGSIQSLNNATQLYQDSLKKWASPRLSKTQRIVLDMAQGATSHVAPQLFAQCGAEIICINNTPNGNNINENSGAVMPDALRAAVLDCNADIGFAFDGDGDRVIAINKYGELKDGDDLLCILLNHPLYQSSKTVVGTIMTNGGLEHHMLLRGTTLIRTPVGDKYIADALAYHQLQLGGEPAGHIILHDKLKMGDGILAALATLETLTHTGNWDMQTFSKYPQVLLKFPVSHRHDLSQMPFAQIIESVRASLHTERILVRYSGTEPILRVMVEAEEPAHALAIGTELVHLLKKAHMEYNHAYLTSTAIRTNS